MVVVVCFTEDINTLMGVVAALASRNSSNCDDLFNLGFQADGVYGIFVGGNIIQTFCEFDRNGSNWMVCWQKKLFDRKII